MRTEDWTVTDKSSRPAGKPDRCFYCGELIGSQHKPECVIRQRTVVLDCTIRVVMPVPEDWDEEMINFHFNESSWCANNILETLSDHVEKGENCLCPRTSIRYVEDATEEDEELWESGIEDVRIEVS